MMIMNWINRIFTPGSQAGTTELLEALTPASGVDSMDQLSAELDRARRYEHPLCVVVLSTSPGSEEPPSLRPEDEDGTIETRVPQIVSLVAASALRDAVRESDVVCYQSSRDRFILGLLHTDEEGAKAALQRIRGVLRSRLRVNTHAGLASFPEDGLTIEDLAAKAATLTHWRWRGDMARREPGRNGARPLSDGQQAAGGE